MGRLASKTSFVRTEVLCTVVGKIHPSPVSTWGWLRSGTYFTIVERFLDFQGRTSLVITSKRNTFPEKTEILKNAKSSFVGLSFSWIPPETSPLLSVVVMA